MRLCHLEAATPLELARLFPPPGRTLCRRCVLPHAPPDIVVDGSGLCSVCRAEAAATCAVPDGRDSLETDFTRILSKVRGKQRYDCLCMLSGGKDSTAALYYVVERYHLNPLVFTFDHGFVGEEALDVIHDVVRQLGVDHVYFRSGYMREMFRQVVKSRSRASICPICSLWYMLKTYEIAARYEVPIIISGWTKGQTSSSTRTVMTKCACNTNGEEYGSMVRDTRAFMEQAVRLVPRYQDFPQNMEGVLVAARKRYGSKATVLSPHWFLAVEPDEYVKILQDRLGWRFPRESYPKNTTNCRLNFLSTVLTVRNYGFSHYHIEASKMIRLGLLTREEALERLAFDFDPVILEEVLADLGCTLADLG